MIKIFVGVTVLLVTGGIASTIDLTNRVTALEERSANIQQSLVDIKEDLKWIKRNIQKE